MQIYNNYTTQKMKFPITDLVTFTEEILNGKLHFFVQCYINTLMENNGMTSRGVFRILSNI